jgi:hypothetical protein
VPQISKTIKGKLVNDSWPEFKVIVSRFDDQDFIENGRQEQVGKIFQFCGDWAPAETSVHRYFRRTLAGPFSRPYLPSRLSVRDLFLAFLLFLKLVMPVE